MIPTRPITLPLALLISVVFAGCSHIPPPREVPPYETLLTLLADFRRFSETDLYRYEIPRDISGQNAFRAALERLNYFEKANPGIDSNVVNFTRGEAYVRLGDYQRAIESYAKVRADAKSPLAPKAADQEKKTLELQSALQRAPEADQLGLYLSDLERIQGRLDALIQRFDGAFEACLARRAREQIDVEYALALFRNRYVLERGSARAIDYVAGMIERHAQSRLIYAHHLMLGEFYFELARDQERLSPPDLLGFDSALFYQLVESAQKQFLIVSQADGYPEKLEGAAMLDAVEALTRKVRDLAK